eukprot:7020668-Prymnesium_polylepis.1
MTSVQGFTGTTTRAFGYLAEVPGVGLVVAFAGTDFTSLRDIYADVSSIVSISVDLGRHVSIDLGGPTNYSVGYGFAGQCANRAAQHSRTRTSRAWHARTPCAANARPALRVH